MPSVSHILKTPDELLALILSKLQRWDLPSILTVNRKFCRVGEDQLDKKCHSAFPIICSDEGLRNADVALRTSYRERIKTLAITVIPTEDKLDKIDSVLRLAQDTLKNVVDLRLSMGQCDDITTFRIACRIQNNTKLRFSLESIGYGFLNYASYTTSPNYFEMIKSVEVTREMGYDSHPYHAFINAIPEGIQRMTNLEELTLYNYTMEGRDFADQQSQKTVSGKLIVQEMIKGIAKNIASPGFQKLTILSPPILFAESKSLVKVLQEIFKDQGKVKVVLAEMDTPAGGIGEVATGV
jgi:hypothetical protein